MATDRESELSHQGRCGNNKGCCALLLIVKLLKRRLCGYPIGEAGLTKTLDFVFHGLISEEGNYVRAFRVIEMEMAFLYDFLYTRFDTSSLKYKG